MLRRTVATFLVNAPGIYAGAGAYKAAKRLGHSVTICERRYAGLVSIDRNAHTLEAAMGIEVWLDEHLLPPIGRLKKQRGAARA